MKNVLVATILSWNACAGFAGEVRIVDATAHLSSDGSYRFDVTLAHADSGWEHYADRWEVLAEDGTLLATRVLHHPHVQEQPFTRSLSSISVPAGDAKVLIRAHDKVHGYGTANFSLEIPR